MTGTSEDSPDETAASRSRLHCLRPEQLIQINECCDRYEQLWREHGFASLIDFLKKVPLVEQEGAFNDELIRELVLIDIELRQRHGLHVNAEDYLQACGSLNRTWLEEQLANSLATSKEADPYEFKSGQRIGDYVILEPLGAGGMGTVYRAEHVLMKRPVALKIVQRQYQTNVLLQRRFEREVRTLGNLSHPNVVTAFDARQDSGWLYLVTELIEGLDLGKLVRQKGPLSPIRAAHYAWQAAQGLHYAHSQGIVHRDIKPENLLLDKNQKIKVLDLGLARFTSPYLEQGSQSGLTESTQVVGTASYISPEQARAATTADARSDIYSLGCTLFFLLTGRPPYKGDSLVATIVAHVAEPIPSAASLSVTPIPQALDNFVQSMMAKDPNDRPASMAVVINELSKMIKQLQSAAQSGSATGASAVTAEATQAIKPLVSKSLRVRTNRTVDVSQILRRLAGRRALLVSVTVAITLIVLASYPTLSRFFSRNPSPGKSLSTLSGLRFNGVDNYVEVDHFDEPITGHVAIEAIVRPNFSNSTSSVVSWTGPQCFVLFRSVGNEWGAAYFDGVTARLIVATHSTRPGTNQLVAAMWDGEQLSLYIDGEPIQSYPIEYEMIPAPNKLFIGGTPDGIIPSHQGTRYLNGEVSVVRVSRSNKPLQIASDPSTLAVRSETLALFDFRKPTYMNTIDQTNRWRARLRGTFSSSR